MHTMTTTPIQAPVRRAARPIPGGGDIGGRDTAPITVAGSARTVEWLSAIGREAGLPWRVRALGGALPRGMLVLAQPARYPRDLGHWTGISRAVVSLDSPRGRDLALSSRVETFTFSERRDAADLTAKDLRQDGERLRLVAVTRTALARVTVHTRDLYPALAALSCAVWLGVPLELAAQTVCAGRQRQGRLIQMA